MKRNSYKIDKKEEEYKAKLESLYIKPDRDAVFYHSAGMEFGKKLRLLKQQQNIRQLETIEMTYEKHLSNLTSLNLLEFAEALTNGYNKGQKH